MHPNASAKPTNPPPPPPKPLKKVGQMQIADLIFMRVYR